MHLLEGTSVSRGWGAGGGAEYSTVTHSTLHPPSAQAPSCPVWDQRREACQALPALLPLPWKSRRPLWFTEVTSGSAAAPGPHPGGLGVVGGGGLRAPSQAESAKQLPLLQKLLLRKGILNSQTSGSLLCSSGPASQKGALEAPSCTADPGDVAGCGAYLCAVT